MTYVEAAVWRFMAILAVVLLAFSVVVDVAKVR